MNSLERFFTCGTLSATTAAQRESSAGSNSVRSGEIAPTAFTCAPAATMPEARMGAVARVTKVTMPAPSTACATEDASSTFNPSALPARPTNAARAAPSRLNARTRRSGRTAATAASWVMACLPVPISAISEAPSAARYFVASPLIPPVRSCPSANASMIAFSDPLWLSNRMSSGAAPLACAQVLVPTKPSSAKMAPIACSVW